MDGDANIPSPGSGKGEERILRGQMTSKEDKRLYRHLDALTRPDESRRESHLITCMCCRPARRLWVESPTSSLCWPTTNLDGVFSINKALLC